MKLHLIAVQPTGTRTSPAFVCPGGFRDVTTDVYPESPRGDELRMLRINHPTMQRREVANALGLSLSDHSALENGRMTLSDDEWAQALATVRALAGGAP